MTLRERFQEMERLDEISLSRVLDHLRVYTCGAITSYRNKYEKTKKQNEKSNIELKDMLLSLGYRVISITGLYIENFNPDKSDEDRKKEQAEKKQAEKEGKTYVPPVYWITDEVGNKLEERKPEIMSTEPSFWVVNSVVEGDDEGELEENLKILGQHYKQESILSVPFGTQGKLIGTKTCPSCYPGEIDKEVEYKASTLGVDSMFSSLFNHRPMSFLESITSQGKLKITEETLPNNPLERERVVSSARTKLRQLNIY